MALDLKLHPQELALKHVFRIAHGARTVQPSLIIELIDGPFSGLGEATATSYYDLTLEDLISQASKAKEWLAHSNLDHPETFYQLLEQYFPSQPALRSAFDIAANDLWAKKQEKPLYQLWDLDPKQAVPSSYTIGLGPIEEMIDKIKETPWPIYKIKLGTSDDLAIIKALREVTNATFRVDANTGWQVDRAVQLAHDFADLGVEFIEQPLAAEDWDGHAHLFERSPLPIIADESMQTINSLDKCATCFHGINIKLLKCGGLTPARKIITTAKAKGLATMIGCMTESSVGISAIAQLAPLLDYVDIDGAILLKNDPAEGIHLLADGHIRYADRPGTGAQLI